MDYFEKLASVGFTVEAVDYTATLSEEEIEKYRLPKGELVPVCKNYSKIRFLKPSVTKTCG